MISNSKSAVWAGGMAPPKLWLGWSKCIETSYLHSEWTLSNFYVTPR